MMRTSSAMLNGIPSVVKPLLACSLCATNVAITANGICAACYAPKPEVPKKARPRPSWDDYFFDMARLVAKRATCPRASIGVVLVDDRHRVISTGFNGALPGDPHCTDVGCTIFADHCVRARHAEISALDSAWQFIKRTADWNVPDSESDNFLKPNRPTAYIVGPRPVCSHCARELHRAGVVEVKWRDS